MDDDKIIDKLMIVNVKTMWYNLGADDDGKK